MDNQIMWPSNNVGLMSVDGKAILITDFSQNYGIQGYKRIHEDLISSIPTGVSYFIFDPTYANGVNGVFYTELAVRAQSGPLTIEISEGAEYTGGTGMLSYNPRRAWGTDTPFVHLSKLLSDATVTEEGTVLARFGGGATGGFFTPDTQADDSSTEPIVIDSTKVYLIKLTNNSGSALTYVKTLFKWFELPLSEL